MSADRPMNKEEVVHIYNGILFRKNEIMQFVATNATNDATRD